MRPCLALAGLLVAAFIGCKGSPPTVPDVVTKPETVYVKASTSFLLAATGPGDREIRFVCDWGDTTDTTVAFRSGDTNLVRHQWPSAGAFDVRFRAVLYTEENRASGWTELVSVNVLPNGIPAIPEFTIPERAVPGGVALFRATTTDPEGDSVSYLFDFGEAVGGWTTLVPSGSEGLDSHRYATMDTFLIRCKARDRKGSESDWSAPETLPVGSVGAVRWWCELPTGNEILAIGPVVLANGRETVFLVAGDHNLYSVELDSRTVRMTEYPYEPQRVSAASYCSKTGHVVLGHAYRLRAYTPQLEAVWFWKPESTPVWNLSPAVVTGDTIYVACDNDSLYCLRDLGTSCEQVGSVFLSGVAGYMAIDQSGNLLAVDDTGCLYKFSPGLDSMIWQRQLDPDAYSPAIGPDGVIVCPAGVPGIEENMLHVVRPDGTVLWEQLVGADPGQPAIGDSAAFVICAGVLDSYDLATGQLNWNAELTNMLVGTPLIIRDGRLYCRSEEGELFCLMASDGSVVWRFRCPTFHAPDCMPRDYSCIASATTASGDVLLTVGDVLFCVAGYPDGTLDTDAPWPKWQHDAYNTGKAGR